MEQGNRVAQQNLLSVDEDVGVSVVGSSNPYSSEAAMRNAACQARVTQYHSETSKLWEMHNATTAIEVGSSLLTLPAIGNFSGNYKSMRRAFIADFRNMPEAKRRPSRNVPTLDASSKDRLHGAMCFIKPGYF